MTKEEVERVALFLLGLGHTAGKHGTRELAEPLIPAVRLMAQGVTVFAHAYCITTPNRIIGSTNDPPNRSSGGGE